MSVPVSVSIDIGDVEQGLHAMERRARQLGPAFKELVRPTRIDQRQHAQQKTGPEASWPPRKLSTLLAHRKLARKRELGRLPTAVSYRALPHSLVGESRVRWSLAHQDGDLVGHGAKLPGRPFLWVSDQLADLAAAVLATALEHAWEGR